MKTISTAILTFSLLVAASQISLGQNHFPTSGNVGINTTSPRASLDVANFINNGHLGTLFGRLAEGDWRNEGTFLGVRGYDTQYSDTYGLKSFGLEHSFYGYINSSINFLRGGTETGGLITFNTNDNTERMRLDEEGNLLIGTKARSIGERLAVNGIIRAKEIKVEASNWPDYVFQPEYQLKPLKQLDTYIKSNGHLPNVPKASEVTEQGIALGEMNKILLEKIEELTLYIIQQDKRIEQLEQGSKVNDTQN